MSRKTVLGDWRGEVQEAGTVGERGNGSPALRTKAQIWHRHEGR